MFPINKVSQAGETIASERQGQAILEYMNNLLRHAENLEARLRVVQGELQGFIPESPTTGQAELVTSSFIERAEYLIRRTEQALFACHEITEKLERF